MEPLTSFEEHYDYIFENIRDMIFILSPEGNIKSVTREFESITGWPREAWLGRHFTDFVHPDDIESVVKKFALVVSGKNPTSYETRVRTISGKYLTFESKSVPHIIDGQMVGFLGIARDITHRKQAEEAIQASVQQYRDIIDSLGDPIHVIDRDFTIILVNPAFINWLDELKIPGLNSNIKGKTIKEAFPFIRRNKVIEEYNSVFTTKRPLVTVEATKIGETTYFTETRKIPIQRGSEVIQIITIIRDISESKRIEKQLRENEERLRGFMDAATDSFSLWDSDLKIVDINKTGLEFFSKETKREDVIGRNMLEFTHNPSDIKNYINVLKTGDPYSSDEVAPHEMFGDLVISVKAFKVGDGLGLITTDITARKKMENELKESEVKFRSIFENVPIGMALTDLDFKFKQVNASFCEMLGYTKEELIQMSFRDISYPEHRESDSNFFEGIKNGETPSSKIEKKYIKKNQDILWARTTLITLQDENKVLTYLLFICEDISDIKEKEEEIRRHLLKYKIEDGNIYLIKEKIPTLSFTVLKDLIEFGYNGFIFSRTHLKDYNESIHEYDIEYTYLNETNTSSKVLEYLETIVGKSAVLIDRLEYLLVTEGFEKTILFIYKLRDIAYLRNLVVILSVDDSTFKERELEILEKETKQVEPRFITNVAEELRDILYTIYQQNALGIKPSYSDIGQFLQISRPTVRKRINRLVTTGYIIENKIGKRKILEISIKGRELLSS